MSIDTLKQALAGLAAAERSQIMAYLLALQDGQDDAYRATLTRKIDEKDPKRWVTLEELDLRLAAKKELAACGSSAVKARVKTCAKHPSSTRASEAS